MTLGNLDPKDRDANHNYDEAEYQELLQNKLQAKSANAFLNMYFMYFNEFEFFMGNDPLEFQPVKTQVMLWIYFIICSFLLGIVLYNSVVAVIGNFYDDYMLKKTQYRFYSTAKLLSNYVDSLDYKIMAKYLYVVKPRFDVDDLDDVQDREDIRNKQLQELINKQHEDVESKI